MQPTRYAILAIFLAFSSCNDTSHVVTMQWQQFYSRDDGHTIERFPLYRAKVPTTWQRSDNNGTVADTTTPICEFHIDDGTDLVQITIHNFPIENFGGRIPPEAQVARWKRQFDILDLSSIQLEPRSLGGFTGLVLNAEGIIKGLERSVIAYSMQLASLHYINVVAREKNLSIQRQIAADYTIKALGSPTAMNRFKSEIALFANSFELIEELPTR